MCVSYTTPHVSLVIGGSRGIGAAAAERLAAKGPVAVVARTRVELEPPLHFYEGDAGNEQVMQELIEQVERDLGPIKALVLCAGAMAPRPALATSRDDLDAAFASNVHPSYVPARLAARLMGRRRYGRIVFVSSTAADFGMVNQAAYAGAKSALVGLARTMARELAPRNVSVNLVSPGPVATELIGSQQAATALLVEHFIPAQRVGTCNEVAAAIAFFASEEAGYITGTVLPVDGGLTMGR